MRIEVKISWVLIGDMSKVQCIKVRKEYILSFRSVYTEGIARIFRQTFDAKAGVGILNVATPHMA